MGAIRRLLARFLPPHCLLLCHLRLSCALSTDASISTSWKCVIRKLVKSFLEFILTHGASLWDEAGNTRKIGRRIIIVNLAISCKGAKQAKKNHETTLRTLRLLRE